MAKYLPHGTTVTFDSVAVGGLVSVGIPDMARGVAETTDSASTFDRRFLPGLRDGGSVELNFRHDPDDVGQLKLEANYLLNSSVVKTCVITLPNGATTATGSRTYTFDAFVTSPPSGDLGLVDDEPAQQTATIKVAGPITIA